MARLEEQYRKEILPQLMEKFAYNSIMQAPKIKKLH